MTDERMIEVRQILCKPVDKFTDHATAKSIEAIQLSTEEILALAHPTKDNRGDLEEIKKILELAAKVHGTFPDNTKEALGFIQTWRTLKPELAKAILAKGYHKHEGNEEFIEGKMREIDERFNDLICQKIDYETFRRIVQKSLEEAPGGEKEVVICAAIKLKCGKIIRGHRHGDCIRNILERKPTPKTLGAIQGFITSQNRFVDRKEGMKIQKSSGIPSAEKDGGYRGDILFSEDLY